MTAPTPLRHQRAALKMLARARSQGRDRALAVMATGTGKTFTAAFDAQRAVANGGRVLFIAHQREILDQAAKTFTTVLDDASVGWFAGGRSDTNIDTADVVFATWQRFDAYRRLRNQEPFAPDAFDYVIIDEAHHAPAATYAPTIDALRPGFMLALTATPERMDDRTFGDDEDRQLHELFGKPVYELPLEAALARDLLAPVDYQLITDDLNERLLEVARDEHWSVDKLNRELFVPRHDAEVASIIAEHQGKLGNPRTVLFCTSIDHATNMAALVPGAVVVHSKLPAANRRALIDGFRNGTHSTIITVDLFNEGIDVPETDLVVFLRSTSSKTIWLQQLGRGLRKADHKSFVRVLDFTASLERIANIAELSESLERETTRIVATQGDREIAHLDVSHIAFDAITVDILTTLR